MSNIKNMNDLREVALETLDKLRNGEIDISEAQTASKLVDNVIATVNSQYVYSKLVGDQPNIPFMQMAHQKQLPNDSIKIINQKENLQLDRD